MLNEYLQAQLNDLEAQGLKRSLKHLEGFQGSRVKIDGRKVLNFCSNNYLGLADDSRLSDAALECMKEQGFGAGASRLVCGNMTAHQKLEAKLTDFKGTQSALLFSSGYMANVGIISSLFGRGDMIYSDRLNHASIIDGIQLSRAKMRRYPHCDLKGLETMLKQDFCGGKRAIITDSIFSMDGDAAPLKELAALAQKYDCVFMIDEAHALGVFGEKGEGLAHHLGVADQIDIHMGTLSKAGGSFGAYCCGSKPLIDFLINTARSFIYTTGMPPSTAAAGLKAIEIIEGDGTGRKKLWENTRYMLAQLKMIGFQTGRSQSPVIPIIIKDARLTVTFSQELFKRGIYVSAIRPPTVPKGTARLRLTVMATHTKEELDYTLNHFQEIGKDLCLL